MKKLTIIVALMMIMSMFSACALPFFDFYKSMHSSNDDLSNKNASEETDDKFKPNDSESNEHIETQKDNGETIRWILALSAFQMYHNDWDYTVFGGGQIETTPEELRSLLKDAWNIYDRASAIENMEWMILEGAKPDFLYYMDTLSLYNLSTADKSKLESELNKLIDDKEAIPYYADAFLDYLKYGRHSIDAWDYCRAVAMLQWCIYVGYYTEDEALEQAFAIAEVVQKQYKSWDEYMESYFRGYEFVYHKSSNERRELLAELKSGADNPFDVDWNTPLVKSWQETKLPESDKFIVTDEASYTIPDNWVISFWNSDDIAKAYCKYGTHTDRFPNTLFIEFHETEYSLDERTLFYMDLMDIFSEYDTKKVITSKTENNYIMYEITISSYYKQFYILDDYRCCCISVEHYSGGSEAEDAARYLANSVVWRYE